MTDRVVDLTDIQRAYVRGQDTVYALKSINLKVARGEFVAIMGPSGSGKSTLMNVLGCLDRPTHGTYYLGGQDVSKMSEDQLAHVRNREIGFIFQQFLLLPKTSALENAALPMLYAGIGGDLRRKKATEALGLVGMGSRLHHTPNQLSGGQQQRVAIARALVNEPTLLLADEPTGALDSQTGKEVMQLLQKLNQSGRTIIMVTHDPAIAQWAKRKILVSDGEIIDDAEVS